MPKFDNWKNRFFPNDNRFLEKNEIIIIIINDIYRSQNSQVQQINIPISHTHEACDVSVPVANSNGQS